MRWRRAGKYPEGASMTESNWPPSQAETLAQLDQWWHELEQTLDGWSEAQMTGPRDAVGWSVKDHLSHLMVWEAGIVALLAKQPRFAAMGFDASAPRTLTEDEMNAHVQQRFAATALAEVRDGLRRTHAALRAGIEAMPPDDLLKGYGHFQPDETAADSRRPVLSWIFGNSSGHFEEHLPWMRAIAESHSL